ncbi:MAG: hypothetical protein ACKVP0_17035 [Pirellulaceae bacterium]
MKKLLSKGKLAVVEEAVMSVEPATKSAAIYQALLELGDPDAPASDVREHVLQKWPGLRKVIEKEKHFNSYVTQNRDRAARGLGMERMKRQGRQSDTSHAVSPSKGDHTVRIGDILDLGKIRSKLKDKHDLVEVVGLVAGLGSETRLKNILAKYVELMKRHDENPEKVEQFLRDIQDLGLQLD